MHKEEGSIYSLGTINSSFSLLPMLLVFHLACSTLKENKGLVCKKSCQFKEKECLERCELSHKSYNNSRGLMAFLSNVFSLCIGTRVFLKYKSGVFFLKSSKSDTFPKQKNIILTFRGFQIGKPPISLGVAILNIGEAFGYGARVNQQSPMHKFVVLSTRWPTFLHLAANEVHHSPFYLFFVADHCILFYFILLFDRFLLGPNLIAILLPFYFHKYCTHLGTLLFTSILTQLPFSPKYHND